MQQDISKENDRFPYEVCELFGRVCGGPQTVKTVTTSLQTHGSHSLSCHQLKYLQASYKLPMLQLAEDCVSSSRAPGGAENSAEGTTCKTPGSSPSCMLPSLLLLSFGCDKAQIFKTLGMQFHTDSRPCLILNRSPAEINSEINNSEFHPLWGQAP